MKRSSSSNWVSPSFNQWDSENDVFSQSPNKNNEASQISSRKIIKPSRIKQRNKKDDFSWAEKYAPESKGELAVHKKKVSEIEDWLKNNLNYTMTTAKRPGVLLLTGPAGTGKTATIKVLANDLACDIQQWSSTPFETLPYYNHPNGIKPKTDMNDVTYQSQSTIFNNFLLRVNKYPSLFSTTANKVLLIEEFPNVYIKDPDLFHSLLRKFCKSVRCPAIFIISDSTSGDSIESRLFPKSIQFELNITNIVLNPIAPTMLTKTLLNICSKVKEEGLIKNIPTKNDIENIALSSMGDLRSAINAFQFFGVPKKSFENKLVSKSKSSQPKQPSNNYNKKDSSLFLFHALGKVLYNKRDNSMKSDLVKLPNHLSHLERPPLIENPEEIYMKTSISSENFVLFLHENYLSFADSIDSIVECSSSLSDSDFISSDWTARNELKNYSSSVATRGLMFYLSSCAGHRWRPLNKPQYFSTLKENRNLSSCVKNNFKDTRLSLKVLETEFIPFLYQINPSSFNRSKSQLIHQIGHMTLKKFTRYQTETLNEKDLIKDDVESQITHPPNFSITTTQIIQNSSSEDEEITIEDYDL